MPAKRDAKVWGEKVYKLSSTAHRYLGRVQKQIRERGRARDTQIGACNYVFAQLGRRILECCSETPIRITEDHPFVVASGCVPPRIDYVGVDMRPHHGNDGNILYLQREQRLIVARPGHNFIVSIVPQDKLYAQPTPPAESGLTALNRANESCMRHHADEFTDHTLDLNGVLPGGITGRSIQLTLPFGWWLNGGKETVLKVLFLSPRFNGQKDDNGNDLNIHGYWNIPADIKKLIFDAIFENQYMGPIIDYVTAQRQAESASASASASGSASASTVEELDDFFGSVVENLDD